MVAALVPSWLFNSAVVSWEKIPVVLPQWEGNSVDSPSRTYMAGNYDHCVVSHKATEDGSPAAAVRHSTVPTSLPRKKRNAFLFFQLEIELRNAILKDAFRKCWMQTDYLINRQGVGYGHHTGKSWATILLPLLKKGGIQFQRGQREMLWACSGINLGSASDTGSIQRARLQLTNKQILCSPALFLFSLCFWLIPSLWCQLF